MDIPGVSDERLNECPSINTPKIPMQYSLKLAFWDRLLQAQYLHRYDSDLMDFFTDQPPAAKRQADESLDSFPEMAREKFYQSGAFFCSGNIVASLNSAFQALQICSFTLGNNHPALTVIMQHIATICESQGLIFEAERMRTEALQIAVKDHRKTSGPSLYLH
jgi:hypothetical protein